MTGMTLLLSCQTFSGWPLHHCWILLLLVALACYDVVAWKDYCLHIEDIDDEGSC